MSGRERFRVHVLGRFRLLTGDTPITIPPRLRKPQELLQALIAFGGTEVSAGVLIDALWPDSEGDAAYHALESALYRLRQLLGARDAVRMEGGKVSLNRDQLWVDMWEFEEELQRPHDPEANGIERIGRLRLLYQGHFLQHETEKPWVLKARQELRDRLLRAIRDAARECEHARRWEDAANLVSIRDRARLAQRGSVSGLDALPPGARRSQRGAAGLQALPRVADALPRHTAQRKDASPLSQRARARSLRHLGRGRRHASLQRRLT
jgi:hypothetical protein